MDTTHTPQLAQHLADTPVASLIPHPDNPRRGDVDAIEESILANGWYGAVVVQRSTNYILAGNHRWQGAQRAGALTVPTLFIDVDDATARRIVLADNRTADLAGYDSGELARLLTSIQQDAGQLAGTGYTNSDLDQIMESLRAVQAESLGDVAPAKGKAKATAIVLGPYRIAVDPQKLADLFATLKQQLGSDDEAAIVAECKRRLKL